jgi:hypothetical protein
VLASFLPFAGTALLAALLHPLDRSAGPQAGRDFATLNVCQIVSGEALARALGGKLADTRAGHTASSSRCVYFISAPPSDKRSGYIVWLQPPADFEALKKYIEEPITTLTGLGDGAYMFRDKGDGRFKIHVLKRGDLMFEASADSAESARKIAGAVVIQLWKKP